MMQVAAIQMVSGTRLEDNLRAARTLLEQAASTGAELAVLPEYFCAMGYKDTDKLALRETPGEGRIQDFLASAARDLRMWVVGGTLPMQTAALARKS
jgi:nitrilase